MANKLTALGRHLAEQGWLARASSSVVRTDLFLLHRSRGRFGLLTMVGMDELVLHTIGRRSGLPRETPLLCVADGDRLLVAASNWGKPTDPAWVHNLRAGGPVRVTRRGRTGPAHVRELAGRERDAAYALMGSRWPAYQRYATRTDRLIPVIEIRL